MFTGGMFDENFNTNNYLIDNILIIIILVLHPLLMLLFRRITNSLVDYGKEANNATTIILTNISEWFV